MVVTYGFPSASPLRRNIAQPNGLGEMISPFHESSVCTTGPPSSPPLSYSIARMAI